MYTKRVLQFSLKSSRHYGRFLQLAKVPALLGLGVICLFSGCLSSPSSFFEDQIGGYRNHVWANRAYNLRYGNCDRQFEDHFKQGFVDGYCAVCEGGDGYVPAIPPEDYWSHQFQSPEGAKCVNTWFRSYPLGAKAAREDGAGAFQKVYISKMVQSAIVQDKADHVLPDDVPVVSSEPQATQNVPGNPYATDPAIEARNGAVHSAVSRYSNQR